MLNVASAVVIILVSACVSSISGTKKHSPDSEGSSSEKQPQYKAVEM